jgi:hypothetical protein|tara:strand:- start:58 stop:753 length:696 start_codon:yes stop_codon:yes gene_type:complete
MKRLWFLFLCFAISGFSQETDSLEVISENEMYIYIEGDSIPKSSIVLDEVTVLPKLKFVNYWENKRYLILRRKTLKVYPYAKLAADRLESLNKRLETLDRKSDKKAYSKKIQKYIEEEFSEELKKLTRTEGQILVKLIYRQTGKTTFDLIKQLRSGWRAFWFNTTASLFDISLKETYNPLEVEEDYLIEDILLRNLQFRDIEGLETALDFNYFEAHKKWSTQKVYAPTNKN